VTSEETELCPATPPPAAAAGETVGRPGETLGEEEGEGSPDVGPGEEDEEGELEMDTEWVSYPVVGAPESEGEVVGVGEE